MLHIVLVEPEIPQNAGNIARTCAATGCVLHMVRPLGFEVSDKYLKRAGLDYWNLVDVKYYDSFDEVQEEAARGNLRVNVYRIRNDFFGETITVAGLLTGRDIAAQLAGQELGETLFFPANALRADGDLFLCGMTPAELSEKLGVPAVPIKNDGAEFIAALTGEGTP